MFLISHSCRRRNVVGGGGVRRFLPSLPPTFLPLYRVINDHRSANGNPLITRLV